MNSSVRDSIALVHHSHEDGSPYLREDCPMFKSISLGIADHIDNEVLWRKDGTSFPVAYSSNPIHKDGGVVGSVVSFRDITDRRQAEAALAASESRTRIILQTAIEGVWMVDNDADHHDCQPGPVPDTGQAAGRDSRPSHF